MPLYEYECKSCDKTVEILVRLPQDQPQCPVCGKTQLDRLWSVPAAPAVKGGSALPLAAGGEHCGAPRCCGGGCEF